KAPAPLDNNQNNNSQNAATATGAPPTGATGAAGATGTEPQPVNAAVMRRPSDRPLTPQTGPGAPPSDDPNDPRNWPPVFLAPATGATGATGAPGAQQNTGQVRPPQIPG